MPLADPAELEKRKADEVRVAQLAKDLDAALDQQFASLAQQMIPQADAYLAAAWEYHDDTHGSFKITTDAHGLVVDYENFAARIREPAALADNS